MSADGHPTKGAVRRAGSTIRAFQRSDADLATSDEALGVLEAHRSRHALPLAKVNSGLRRFCHSIGVEGEVSQRLKNG